MINIVIGVLVLATVIVYLNIFRMMFEANSMFNSMDKKLNEMLETETRKHKK